LESNREEDDDSDDLPDMPMMTGEQLDQSQDVINTNGLIFQESDSMQMDTLKSSAVKQ